jgi:hypothetical protein
MGWLGQPYSDTENKVGITLRHLPGTDQELEVVSRLDALILQDPVGQTQAEDMGAAADPGAELAAAVRLSFGTPFIIEAVCHGAETDGQVHNFAVFNKDAPYKFKVLLAWGVVLDETGTVAGDTVTLSRGDGADSESFVTITDAISCNVSDDVLFGLVAGTSQFNQDNAVIDEDESLRVVLTLADSSNHNTAVKVYMLCMRCIADE